MGCLINIFWWAVTIAVAIGQYLKQQEKAAQEERDRQFHRDHPEAKARSKPEARLKRLVTDMFPGQCECEYCPPWLQGLRIDAAVPAHRLAFEYNGRQHYQFTEHFHETHSGFQRQKERDDRKADLLRQHGWTLIVVSYKEKDRLGEGYLMGRLRQAGVVFAPPPPQEVQRFEKRWVVRQGDTNSAPYTETELIRLMRRGQLTGSAWVKRAAGGPWKRLAEVATQSPTPNREERHVN